MSDSPKKIVAIIGSASPTSNTAKIVNAALADLGPRDVEIDVIDPTTLTLPLPGQTAGASDAEAIQALVSGADGLIISTPEYHGSYSSVIKLIIDNLGYPSTMKDKPVALIGVAAGVLGATKALEHLRSTLSHVGAFVLPSVVSVAAIHKAFNEDGSLADEGLQERLAKLNTALLDFIRR